MECKTHPDARLFTTDECPHIIARQIPEGHHAHQLKGRGWITCEGA